MLIFSLALRNIFRNRRRSVLTIAGIVAGIWGIIIIGGYYEYNYWGLRESMIRSQFAHVQLNVRGYREYQERDPFGYPIPRWEELASWLDSQAEVETVTPHLDFWAVADNGRGTSALVKVRGIVPERENKMNTFFTIKKGSDLYTGAGAQAELGVSLADALDVGIGDVFSLSTVMADGTQNALEVSVRSLIGSYSEDFDQRNLRLPMEAAVELCGSSGVQELDVLLESTDDTGDFKRKLESVLPGLGWDLEVSSWDQHATYYTQVVEFYGGYFRIVLAIVVIVVFFSTLNTMIMAIVERTAEVGTLRSFGMSTERILLQFLCEGLALGVIGTTVGLAVSLGSAWLINFAGGIHMPPPPGLTTSVQVKIMVTSGTAFIAGGIGIIVPLIAALIPSLQTLRTQIIDQIRYNT
jgi:putative ABC transport system permease protein